MRRDATLVLMRYGRLEIPGRFVELANGTAFKTAPVSLDVTKPTAVRPNYTMYYALVFKTPLGVNKTWVEAGGAVAPRPRLVDLGNGTALLLKPAEVRVRLTNGEIRGTLSEFTAYGPAEVVYRGERMYEVTVATPLGVNKTWIAEGGHFAYEPPHFLDLGNGTALRGPNGTCVFTAAMPVKCAVFYAERLYRLRISTPTAAAEEWAPAGAVYKPPSVIELGNLTRLVDPQPAEITVDGPKAVSVVYRRQYWVEVRGVSEWRGWAYEGAEIPLNETEIGGVRYIPLTPRVEVRGPLNTTARYKAVFQTTARDPLGVPDPTAWAYLCGVRFNADALGVIRGAVETDRLCDAVVARQWPISPYTLALVAVAAVAALIVVRRKR